VNPREALAAHIATNPGRPSLSLPMDQYRPLMLVYEKWLLVRGQLESAVNVEGIVINPVDQTKPSCMPRADYQWRDIPKRPSRAKGAWKTDTTEYNRVKKAESRAKKGCRDCGGPKVEKKSRCLACQAKAEEAQRKAKNEVSANRKRLIREGLNQRRQEAA